MHWFKLLYTFYGVTKGHRLFSYRRQMRTTIFLESNVTFFNKFGQFFPIKRLFLLPQCFFFDRANPQNSMVAQPAPINTNPFGTLPALPQMSIGRVGNTPSVQYGISSMPVNDVS
jgi:hypothetical protein